MKQKAIENYRKWLILNRPNLKCQTIDTYINRVINLLNKININPEITQQELKEIDVKLIEDFFFELRENKKNNTYNMYYEPIINLFKSNNLEFMLLNDNNEKIIKKMPITTKKPNTFYDEEEAVEFLKFVHNYSFRNQKTADKYELATVIFLNVGLRIGELANLSIKDIDTKHNVLNIRHETENTKKSRIVKIHSRIMAQIIQYISTYNIEKGELLQSKPRALNKMMKKLLVDFGREDMTCHDLRKTYITLNCTKVNLKTLAKRVGQSLKVLTEIYLNAQDEDVTDDCVLGFEDKEL